MTSPVDPQAVSLIKSFEGCLRPIAGGLLEPYLCPANVPTIGYGCTYYEGHRKVTLHDQPITKQRAEDLLAIQLQNEYAPAVDRMVKVPIHPLMRGALISLCYNIGSGALAKSSVMRLVNQQRWSEVPKAFSLYRMGGGRILNGLVRRRAAEAAMFMAGVSAMKSPAQPVLVASQPAPAAKPATSRFSRFAALFREAA